MSAGTSPEPNAIERLVGRTMSRRWDGGWLRQARRCPSPNFNERPGGTEISLALIHSISLPPGQFGGDGVERLFTNRLDWDTHPYFQTIRGIEVSAHFFVRRDGELLQFVSCDDRAWHAGTSVWRARPGCNDYSVGIELEGLEGSAFEASQYAELKGLLADLRDRYPIAAIAGHEHVAPGRKCDPGPGFDWSHLAGLIDWMEDPANGGLMPRSADV